MGDKPKKITENLTCKGELGQAPEGSEGKLKPYPNGRTASVDNEVCMYIQCDQREVYMYNICSTDQFVREFTT